MHLYKIGYYSPEESNYFELRHKNKYTDEELHKIVMEAIASVLSHIVSSNNEHDVCISKEFGLSYQEIDDLTIKELEKVGFEPITYQAEWACFGWQSIIDEDHWEGQRDETANRIFEELPTKLINQLNQLQR